MNQSKKVKRFRERDGSTSFLAVAAILTVITASATLGAGLKLEVHAQTEGLKVVSSSSYVDSFDTMHIVGEIQNTSPDEMTTDYGMRVVATLYDADGRVVGSEFGFTELHNVEAGGKIPFNISVLEQSTRAEPIANFTVQAETTA